MKLLTKPQATVETIALKKRLFGFKSRILEEGEQAAPGELLTTGKMTFNEIQVEGLPFTPETKHEFIDIDSFRFHGLITTELNAGVTTCVYDYFTIRQEIA